ncbi:MAG: twin-arginine translocase subunit TatB [Alphaproteobacteria bacterium]|nr:twin-arginine translocase subunit TatB [Alphaproteobacteria bacterium]
MFDIGWSELLVVVAVALIVVGPREIPRVLRTMREFMAKIRSVTTDFQSAMDEAACSADLEDIKKNLLKEQHDMSGDKLFQEILGERAVKEEQGAVEDVKTVSQMQLHTDPNAPKKTAALNPETSKPSIAADSDASPASKEKP